MIVRLQDPNKISHAGPVSAVAEASSRLGLICFSAPPDTLDEGRDQHHGFVLRGMITLEHFSNVQTRKRCQTISKIFVLAACACFRPSAKSAAGKIVMQHGNTPKLNGFSRPCRLPLCSVLDRPWARLRLQYALHSWVEGVMPEYRVYTIGHTDGQFIAVRSIECPNDQAAIRQARQMLDGHSLEVWELERFIVRLDHQPPTEHNS